MCAGMYEGKRVQACVQVNMCAGVCAGKHVQVCVWTCVHMHLLAEDILWGSSSGFHHLLFEIRGSHWPRSQQGDPVSPGSVLFPTHPALKL